LIDYVFLFVVVIVVFGGGGGGIIVLVCVISLDLNQIYNNKNLPFFYDY